MGIKGEIEWDGNEEESGDEEGMKAQNKHCGNEQTEKSGNEVEMRSRWMENVSRWKEEEKLGLGE